MKSKNFVICLIIIAAYRVGSVCSDNVQILQRDVMPKGQTSSARAFVPRSPFSIGKEIDFKNCRTVRHPLIDVRCQSAVLSESPMIKGDIVSFSKFRNSVLGSYEKIPRENQSIVKSMLWGELVFDSVFTDFKSLGLLHLFSVSGLHVNFIYAIVAMFLRLIVIFTKSILYLPRIWTFFERFYVVRFSSLIGVLVYVGLCEFRPPSVRAFLILAMGFWIAHPGSKIRKTSGAMALHLIWSPESVFSVSFGLSWSIFILLAGQSWNRTHSPIISLLRLQVMIYFLGCYWLGIQSLNSIFFNLLFLPLASVLFYIVLIYSFTFSWCDFLGPVLKIFLFLIHKSSEFGDYVKNPVYVHWYQALKFIEPGLSVLLVVIILNSLGNMAKTDRELVMNHEG